MCACSLVVSIPYCGCGELGSNPTYHILNIFAFYVSTPDYTSKFTAYLLPLHEMTIDTETGPLRLENLQRLEITPVQASTRLPRSIIPQWVGRGEWYQLPVLKLNDHIVLDVNQYVEPFDGPGVAVLHRAITLRPAKDQRLCESTAGCIHFTVVARTPNLRSDVNISISL